MPTQDDFDERLNKALSPYQDSLTLVDDLINQGRNPQEIILLVCARLDSLANLSRRDTKGQQQAFRRFISNYSGDGNHLDAISVGDLYFELVSWAWMADGGIIEKPGRIRRFGSESNEFLEFIVDSQVAITGTAVQQLTNRVAKTLAKHFRVKSRQSLSKACTARREQIRKSIEDDIQQPDSDKLFKALDGLLDKFEASSILYERYRCGVIHGYQVDVDLDRFYKDVNPFHTAFDSIHGSILRIQFPALYLRHLLARCFETYSYQLKAQRKVPSELFNEMYSLDEMIDGSATNHLDQTTLEEFKNVSLQVKPR